MSFLEHKLTGHIEVELFTETTSDRVKKLPNGDKRTDFSISGETPYGVDKLKEAMKHDPWFGGDYHIKDMLDSKRKASIINKYVKANDHLIIMGDMEDHDDPDIDVVKDFVRRIVCKNKYLIIGNNDSFPLEEYKEMGICCVTDIFQYKNYTLSHFPLEVKDGDCCIHAHLHGAANEDQKGADAYWYCDGAKCYDIWSDNFIPIRLSTIEKEFYHTAMESVMVPAIAKPQKDYYRVTYEGEGIYEAVRKRVGMETWKMLLKNANISWLPKPPVYYSGYMSYFTEYGYEIFQKTSLPILSSYLTKSKIKVEKMDKPGYIMYQDEYQVVTTNDTGILLLNIAKFNEKLNGMKYQIRNKEYYMKDTDSEDFDKCYRVLSPQDFIKYGGGVCWDYVIYQEYYFNKFFPRIEVHTFYHQTIHENKDDCPSHTFMIFTIDKRWFWFESSWKDHMGIWEFASLNDTISYISDELIKHAKSEPDISEYKDEFIVEYKALNPESYGQTCVEFMTHKYHLPQYKYHKKHGVKPIKRYLNKNQYRQINKNRPVMESGNMTFTSSTQDVADIVETLPLQERKYIASRDHDKKSFPSIFANHTKYLIHREVLKEDIPIAFCDVVSFDPGVGIIVLAVRSGKEYRHKGYGSILVERMLKKIKATKKVEKLIWKFDNDNTKSVLMAKKFGFSGEGNELELVVESDNIGSDVHVPKTVKLYHGSPLQGLKVINAFAEHKPEWFTKEERVFASPEKAFAACYGARWHDGIAHQGTFDGVLYYAPTDEVDMGSPCSLYEIVNDGTFIMRGHHECYTTHPVRVKKEVTFNSFSDMLKAFNVNIIPYEEYERRRKKCRLLPQHINESGNYEKKDSNEEVMEESVIFSKKNIELNMNLWKMNHANVLYITGLSGAGKTTLSKTYASKDVEVIEFDALTTSLIRGINTLRHPELIHPLVIEYLNTIKYTTTIKWTDGGVLETHCRAFVEFLENRAKQENKKYVLEGTQIYSYIPASYFRDKPLIILGVSLLRSLKQRTSRSVGKEDKLMEKLAAFLHELGLIPLLYKNEKKKNDFENDVELMEEFHFDTMIAEPSTFLKGITLYHYSNRDMNKIIPRTVNAGNKLARPRLSSWWTTNLYQGGWVLFMGLSSTFPEEKKKRFVWSVGEIDGKKQSVGVISKSLFLEQKEWFKNFKVYKYTKTFEAGEVGMGTEYSVKEYTCDKEVIPDKKEVLSLDEIMKTIKVVPDSQIPFYVNKWKEIKDSGIHLQDLLVDKKPWIYWDYEKGQELKKKYVEKHPGTQTTGEIDRTNDDEIIESVFSESVLFKRDNLYFNTKTLRPGTDNNVVFITGFPGAGKTTTLQQIQNKFQYVEGISLDFLTVPLVKTKRANDWREWLDKKPEVSIFIKGYLDKNYDRIKLLNNDFNDPRLIPIYLDFIDYVKIELMKPEYKNYIAVIEGTQLFSIFVENPNYFDDKAFILIGTSLLTAFCRKIKRDVVTDKNYTWENIKRQLGMIPVYKGYNKILEKIYKKYDNENDGDSFLNYMNK